MLTLYDAARCPYCARARIVLAEKGIPYDPVEVDLDEPPAWVLELNPPAAPPPASRSSASRPIGATRTTTSTSSGRRAPSPGSRPPSVPSSGASRPTRTWPGGATASPTSPTCPGSCGARRGSESTPPPTPGPPPSPPRLSSPPPPPACGPWTLRSETRLGIALSPYAWLSAWLERLLERPAVTAEREVV